MTLQNKFSYFFFILILCTFLFSNLSNEHKILANPDNSLAVYYEILEKPIVNGNTKMQFIVQNTSGIRSNHLNLEINLPEGITLSSCDENLSPNVIRSKLNWTDVTDLLPGEKFLVNCVFDIFDSSGDMKSFDLSGSATAYKQDSEYDTVTKEFNFKIETSNFRIINTKNPDVLVDSSQNHKTTVSFTLQGQEFFQDVNSNIDLRIKFPLEIEYTPNSLKIKHSKSDVAISHSISVDDKQNQISLQFSDIHQSIFTDPIEVSFEIFAPYLARKGGDVFGDEDFQNNGHITIDHSQPLLIHAEYSGDEFNYKDNKNLKVNIHYTQTNLKIENHNLQPGDVTNLTAEFVVSPHYKIDMLESEIILPDGIELLEYPENAKVSTINGITYIEFENTGETALFKIKLKQNYIDNSVIYSGDTFKINQKTKLAWSDLEKANRSGKNSFENSAHLSTPLPKLFLQFLNTKTGEWIDTDLFIKPLSLVSGRIVIQLPSKTPVNLLELSNYVPPFMSLESYPPSCEVTRGDVDFFTCKTFNNDLEQIIAFSINQDLEIPEDLLEKQFRNIVILRSINSKGSVFSVRKDNSLRIGYASGTIMLNNNQKFTRLDVVKRQLTIEVPESNKTTHIRFIYCNNQNECNSEETSKSSEWIDASKVLTEDFDYLIDRTKYGTKTICFQIKDGETVFPKLYCDSIILDAIRPISTIELKEDSVQDTEIETIKKVDFKVANSDPILTDGQSGSGIDKRYVSTDQSNWVEITDDNILGFRIPVIDGKLTLFSKSVDKIGNESRVVFDEIVIEDQSQELVSIYKAPFEDTPKIRELTLDTLEDVKIDLVDRNWQAVQQDDTIMFARVNNTVSWLWQESFICNASSMPVYDSETMQTMITTLTAGTRIKTMIFDVYLEKQMIVTEDGLIGWIHSVYICKDAQDVVYNEIDGINFVDPVASDVLQVFGPTENGFNDSVTYQANCLVPVYPLANGIVRNIIPTFGENLRIEIAHNDGTSNFISSYESIIQSNLYIGQKLKLSDSIGRTGLRLNTTCDLLVQLKKAVGENYYSVDPIIFTKGQNPFVVINDILSNILGDSFSLLTPTNPDFINLYLQSRPVFRFWNGCVGDHLYTINANEINYIKSLDCWTYEGVGFYAFKSQLENTVPVYGFWNESKGDHHYTISDAEKEILLSSPEWKYENIVFYTYPREINSAVRVNRYFNLNNYNHFFTTSPEEINALNNSTDWRKEFNHPGVFYAFPNAIGKLIADNKLSEIISGFPNIIETGSFEPFCGTRKVTLTFANGPVFGDLIYNNALQDGFLVKAENGLSKLYSEFPNVCLKIGLPISNIATAATSPQGTTGEYQQFEFGTLYSSSKGTWMVYGEMEKLYETESTGGTGGRYGFVVGEQYFDEIKRADCQDFEGGNLCITRCESGEVWSGNRCVDQKEFECQLKGSNWHKYVNPNDPSDVVCAVINDAPYFNQYMDVNGNLYIPEIGWMTCSAASTVMGLIGLKSLPNKDYESNKSFVTQDSPFSNNGINLSHINKSCPNLQGAFAYTAIANLCNQGFWPNIEYFIVQGFGRTFQGRGIRDSDHSKSFTDIQNIIDLNGLAIQGVWNSSISHILLIRGYTDDMRIIVNDSFRNLMEEGLSYNYGGNGALYELNSNNLNFGNFINFN